MSWESPLGPASRRLCSGRSRQAAPGRGRWQRMTLRLDRSFRRSIAWFRRGRSGPSSLSADSGARTPGSGVCRESSGRVSATPAARLRTRPTRISATTRSRSRSSSTPHGSPIGICWRSSGRRTTRHITAQAGSTARRSSGRTRSRGGSRMIRGGFWSAAQGAMSRRPSSRSDASPSLKTTIRSTTCAPRRRSRRPSTASTRTSVTSRLRPPPRA